MKLFKQELKQLRDLAGVSFNRHHRCCRCQNGADTPENISLVRKKHHSAWHTLWGSKTPQEIASDINNIWLDPGYKFICIPSNCDVVIIRRKGNV